MSDSSETPQPIINPYAIQSPSEPMIADTPTKGDIVVSRGFARTLLTWAIVCTISAAPSFLIAYNAVNDQGVTAMVIGIVIFTLIYTAADYRTRNMVFRTSKLGRGVLRAAFAIRTLSVVVFPIALMSDMFVGFASVTITSALFGRTNFSSFPENSMSGFFWTLSTTLLQGFLLSCLIMLMSFLIFGICVVYNEIVRRTRS